VSISVFEDDRELSKQYPLNNQIKDSDVFLHGTSLKKYESIKAKAFLLRSVDSTRNFLISNTGIYFEKYTKANAKTINELAMPHYCRNPCKKDGSLEGVVLKITGKELKMLGCPIYADWNKSIQRIYDSLHRTIGIKYDCVFVSIIVVDKDIPIEYLSVQRRIPFTEEDLADA
jgi:hypothetical protein